MLHQNVEYTRAIEHGSSHINSKSYVSFGIPCTTDRSLETCARALLRRAAAACTAQTGTANIAPGGAAADDLAVIRPFMYALGLLYGVCGTLGCHVDHQGSYVVLVSLGCTVEFWVDGTLIELASGDALDFHGGSAHLVEHGLQAVRPGTCPPTLSAELSDKRLTVLLRQQ